MNVSKDELPEKIQKRIGLSGMFYPLERKYERRWANLFRSDFDKIVIGLAEHAGEKNYAQETISKNAVIWKDPDDKSVECMFYFIDDPSDLDSVMDIFKVIKKVQPFFTYAIVHQVKDGENCYDIFRLSKFSYLEHCNRVKYELKKAKK